LRLLLEHRGRVLYRSVGYTTAWVTALRVNDTRYLEMLFEFGARDGIKGAPRYDRYAMRRISPEVLRYMFDIGYTGGLREHIDPIVGGSRRLAEVLEILPPEWLYDLSSNLYPKVVQALQAAGEHDRAYNLLDRLDGARVIAELSGNDQYEALTSLFDCGFNPMSLTNAVMTSAGPRLTHNVRHRCGLLRFMAQSIAE